MRSDVMTPTQEAAAVAEISDRLSMSSIGDGTGGEMRGARGASERTWGVGGRSAGSQSSGGRGQPHLFPGMGGGIGLDDALSVSFSRGSGGDRIPDRRYQRSQRELLGTGSGTGIDENGGFATLIPSTAVIVPLTGLGLAMAWSGGTVPGAGLEPGRSSAEWERHRETSARGAREAHSHGSLFPGDALFPGDLTGAASAGAGAAMGVGVRAMGDASPVDSDSDSNSNSGFSGDGDWSEGDEDEDEDTDRAAEGEEEDLVRSLGNSRLGLSAAEGGSGSGSWIGLVRNRNRSSTDGSGTVEEIAMSRPVPMAVTGAGSMGGNSGYQ